MKTLLILFLTLILSNFVTAALHIRDLDGDWSNGHEGVYDDVLDITWLADANLGASNHFGLTGINNNGSMGWQTAESFITAINLVNSNEGYLGVDTWRQSTVTPINGSSFNTNFSTDGSTDNSYQLSAPLSENNPYGQSVGFTGSELAYHYYNNLGGLGACFGIAASIISCPGSDVSGTDDATNTAILSLFINIVNFGYWTGTENPASDQYSIVFDMPIGIQAPNVPKELSDFYVWVVTDGDVGTAVVPIPATAWLFISAIVGLYTVKRKLS